LFRNLFFKIEALPDPLRKRKSLRFIPRVMVKITVRVRVRFISRVMVTITVRVRVSVCVRVRVRVGVLGLGLAC